MRILPTFAPSAVVSGYVLCANTKLSSNTAHKRVYFWVLFLTLLWYNCETGKIGTTNHVHFDEDMNDLPSNSIPSNQRDLERVEQGNKFPAKPNEVDVDKEFKFFVYPFFKMEEKTLRIRPACMSTSV